VSAHSCVRACVRACVRVRACVTLGRLWRNSMASRTRRGVGWPRVARSATCAQDSTKPDKKYIHALLSRLGCGGSSSSSSAADRLCCADDDTPDDDDDGGDVADDDDCASSHSAFSCEGGIQSMSTRGPNVLVPHRYVSNRDRVWHQWL
jgi:hypothetical protein